jgi:putative nucleotidyltransferase with HDIG domain
MLAHGKILFICDDKSYVNELKGQLSGLGDYTIAAESTAQAGVISLKESACDLIIIRYAIPDLDILSAIADLRKVDPDCVIVVLIEAEAGRDNSQFADVGVFDVLAWPVKKDNLKFVVEKGIKLHNLLAAGRKTIQGLKENNQSLEKQNTLLAKRIEDSTSNLSRLYEDLRSTYMRTIRVLAQAIDARDHYTHSHSENVARYAVAIANQLRLPAKEVELIRQACELHDLGKIGIGDSILLKPAALTSSEWEQIKKHPTIGAQILEPLTFLNGVVELVRQHHEHYDGTGYPEGRKGEDILLGARIIHVADSYEAMRSARSYRKVPLMKEEAILEIKLNSGTQFDPKIVEAFLQVVDNL